MARIPWIAPEYFDRGQWFDTNNGLPALFGDIALRLRPWDDDAFQDMVLSDPELRTAYAQERSESTKSEESASRNRKMVAEFMVSPVGPLAGWRNVEHPDTGEPLEFHPDTARDLLAMRSGVILANAISTLARNLAKFTQRQEEAAGKACASGSGGT